LQALLAASGAQIPVLRNHDRESGNATDAARGQYAGAVSTSHAHNHAAGATNRRRLLIAIAIIGTFFVVELVGAALSNSLALLADAGHMLSDLVGLFVALIAFSVARRPATDRQTFGFQRAEVFGALVNGLLLLGIAVFVSVEGAARLFDSGRTEVFAVPMLLVGVAGLFANLAALLVVRGGAATSIGMRGAYLEILGDLIGSMVTIGAAVVILTTGFVRADAIGSLLIAGLIIPRAILLLRDVVRVLSDSTPSDTNLAEIREHIRGTVGVVDVHDVHVWAITSGARVFTAHVIVEPTVLSEGRSGLLLDALTDCLSAHFDVAHSTFQLEPAEHAAHEDSPHR
jgi:cobalt-zinc-cadmium efflux system protein